jgi:[lysine-biosynthesis-protein LysW]--L-2-aminoadipate ligase
VILGVIYDVLRWEEKNIITEAKRMGHKVFPIYVRDYVFSSKKFNLDNNADIFMQRSVSHSRAIITSILIETLGYRSINDYYTLFRVSNKLLTLMLLKKHNILVPEFIVAFEKEKVIESSKELGYPLVIKPIEGSWGRMVAKANDSDTLRSFMEYQDYTSQQYKTVYFIQEYINKPNRDIRIFVIGDEAPVGIYRINNKNWRTNTALGAIAEKLKIDKELEDLALKVKEIVGGYFLGIDIFEDKDRGYIVNEVNGVPEFKNTVRVTGYNIAENLIRSIEAELKK